MKRMSVIFGLLGLMLVLSDRASAQFINHFNTYVSQSIALNGGTPTMNQTVTLTGYTQVPPSMPTSGVHHTPGVQNKIGSVGGWTYGTPVCPTCQVYASSNIIGDVNLGNLIEEDDTITTVQCSIAGTFFWANATLHIEIAYTRAISLGTRSNCYWNKAVTQEVCTIAAQPWCTSLTSPPDWPLNAVDSQVYPGPAPNWWEAWNVCTSYGAVGNLRPWLCLPTGVALEKYTSLPAQANCSYNL